MRPPNALKLSKRAASPVPADWTYAPAPESLEIVSLQERYGLFVGGEWVEPRSGESFTTISPRDVEQMETAAANLRRSIAKFCQIHAATQANGGIVGGFLPGWNEEILQCESRCIEGRRRSRSEYLHGSGLDVTQQRHREPL